MPAHPCSIAPETFVTAPAQVAFERVVESATGLEKLQGAKMAEAGREVLEPIQTGMKVGAAQGWAGGCFALMHPLNAAGSGAIGWASQEAGFVGAGWQWGQGRRIACMCPARRSLTAPDPTCSLPLPRSSRCLM